MRSKDFRGGVKAAVLTGVAVLLFGGGVSFAQQQINLTAGPTSVSLPDGQTVPMWGYTCGLGVSGSTAACAKSNPAAAAWSPVVIKVPTGQDLQINLTNNLSFVAGTSSNNVPTSLVIVGQLGGGLGTTATTTPSPAHATQNATWPIAGDSTGPQFTPPAQGSRVQSFSTEVATGATTSLTWKNLRPGTYLIESGTHPSIQGAMGLFGMLVVTTAPSGTSAGTAYPNVAYKADVPLLLSEIDPVQNKAVDAAVHTAGFSEMTVWSGQPGGCGNPSSATYNTCYPPAVNYDPRYYLINGVAFDKNNATSSAFSTSPSAVTGTVLVRFVNAGLRMHVPSIVGAQTGTPAVPGFSLIAEDGNPLPGTRRVQSEVFLAAGKTYDVLVNAAAGAAALPVFDRQLSLSANNQRDSGMQGYIAVNGGVPPVVATAQANPDKYFLVPGKTLSISDPAQGLIANDVNVYGVKVSTSAANGSLTLNPDGTFTYVPNSGTTADSFSYCGNGSSSGAACATVNLNAAVMEGAGGIHVLNDSYQGKVANALNISRPGVLANDYDDGGYPLSVVPTSVVAVAGLNVVASEDGSFTATANAPGTYSFTYTAKNSQGTVSGASATVSLTFPAGSGLKVTVLDGQDKTTQISDYRWIIEEDRTFAINPTTQTNTGTTVVPTFGTNFHTSYMPVVAQGCVGTVACESGQTLLGQPAVCDIGNGVCRTTGAQQTVVDPGQVALDPNKRYYISVMPGDAANPFEGVSNGHGMGGAPIAAGQTNVTVLVEPTPLETAKISVFVFEDDNPLNGENDAGGGVDVLAPNEPGLGGFEITLFDDAGGSGDATGQMTYDMFNMPLSNSLAGQLDPATGLDACPISQQAGSDPKQKGITGTIVTCPTYESDGKTLSPLAGQALIANMMPGRYGVVATPGADRIGRGEEWLQTNTLDGQKAHDSFIKVGGPSYFQEYGPAGYHVAVGFANPKIINARLPEECANQTCNNTLKGTVTTTRMSRTPDERLYSSGSRDSFSFTQCYVSLGDPDGADIAFAKCNADGTFTLPGLPNGTWRLTVFDQWNDQLVDGLSTPVPALTGGQTLDMGDVPVSQWHANIYTRTFFDLNGDGVPQDNEPGLALVPTNIRFRDGSFSNFNNTDLSGNAGFNEIFPLFNWYVIETDSTRYKNTGTHVVYDAGGPADGTSGGGTSNIAQFFANTVEPNPLPGNLHVPGAVYCNSADCTGQSIKDGPNTGSTPNTTGRIDPSWVTSYGWQGFSGQNSFLEFGKAPFANGENGGIRGHVVYASTRPFDDPQLLLQLSWEPLVPGVTINLYQEGTGADGTYSLKLVDTTKTSSWDDWAQGFRSDGVPNMNCPGQSTSDLFFFSLYNQPMYLNPGPGVPNNSQFKCYDGMHNWNQLQPAPYDGMYQFPSVNTRNPLTGSPTGTNCTACTTNPIDGTPMLPAGKYVVEVVVPPGYELVKEEDKNILIGDNYIAPVTQQFAGLGSIFILPDQAAVTSSYNSYNAQNSTQDLGRVSSLPSHEGDTGSVETFWPCVGQARIVPDYISLYPQSAEVSPFAGATRNLCDRKEITLEDQSSALAKFYVFSSTHVAAHFTGVITDDFTSEFDPFSPQFGEKFSPPNLPVSIKDFRGNEVSRVYTDQWGTFNGLNYSTWEVNPPNPTGYAPTMMVTCMNDPGNGPVPDPLYNPTYSQFCYEIPFMPGQTQYMDTPVVPTAAFSEGYNHPDCAYPDATPAVKEVDGDGVGPWVSAPGKTLTITALGDQLVQNHAYSGPSATKAPYNQKTVMRHFGFGNTAGTVTIGGTRAVVSSWNDTQIKVTVPAGVPACAQQQLAQYGGPNGSTVTAARCGELLITAANGKQSIDTVTVTVGGKAPAVLASGQTIQSAIDAAAPGDLIIVPPGAYNEMLLMWKPVRLQGVAAASSVINANSHPSGNLKLDPWRRQVNCLFGLALNGQPSTGNNGPGGTGGGSNPYDSNYDPAAGTGFACPASMQLQTDRIDLEGIVGWDTTVNGNLAELLQEPTLMGAYEGAGITVLAKGVRYPAGVDPFHVLNGDGLPGESVFPSGTVLLTNNTADCTDYVGNFLCNPSRIDGLSITNSSQGGGGIFLHGWAHNLEIANDRISNNSGTLTGGISIGQGEFSDPIVVDAETFNNAAIAAGQRNPGYADPTTVVPPRPIPANTPSGTQLAYGFNTNVNIHNNSITGNASYGDELFSATPAGAGGVTFCSGSDYYDFQYNWLCGNVSSGDGGGLAHLGFSYNGDIEHNTIIFNQSTNPTIPTHGGGIIVMSTAPDAPTIQNGVIVATECGSTSDVDCGPGLSDGTGPDLLINANVIVGNGAESGSGGGLRLQLVNGDEISRFPLNPGRWYDVRVTNNIISNNVAGWDGGGVSLQDALNVNFINNTVVSNDSTASSGVLFNTLGAPQGSTPPPGCNPSSGTGCGNSVTTSTPQVAGLVTMGNTANLTGSLPATIRCPVGHSSGNSATPVANGDCRQISYPLLLNDIFWQNRTFNISVGGYANQYQQNLVSLVPSLNQPTAPSVGANGAGTVITGGTGACVSGANYWDIGVRGDTGPNTHTSFTLNPMYSVLTDAADYATIAPTAAAANNTGSNPQVVSQYCNGSRVPPENGGLGYQVPPGISDATVPNPIFNLTPAATVDEGNNWINISWGPLALTNPAVQSESDGNYGGGSPLGNYLLSSTSPAIDYIPTASAAGAAAPKKDLFGNPRPDPANPAAFDVGAVEFQANAPRLTSIAPNGGYRGTTVNVTLTGTNLTGTSEVDISAVNITVSNVTVVNDTTVTATFVIAPATALGGKNVTVLTPIGKSNSVTFMVSNPPAPTVSSISPNSGLKGATVNVTLTGTALATTTSVNPGAANISVSNVVAVSDTKVTATFTIDPATAIGNKSVTVTTLGGTTGVVTFTVQGPTLTSISPVSGVRGTNVPVTINGNGLSGASAVSAGTGITSTINSVNSNGTQITATFAIGSGTGVTANTRNVIVTTPIGPTLATSAATFTVLAPTLSSISPNTGVRGSSVNVSLTGTNLSGATRINVPALGGITVSNFNVVSSTNVTATFGIANTATLGGQSVSVTTQGGAATGNVTFTVTGATLASINPTSAFRGTSTPVTLTGTHLTGATGLTISGNGTGPITVTGFSVVNDSTVTATLNIPLNATISSRSISVATPIGTTGTVAFGVQGPILNSITPASGVHGTAVNVTLTGTNLTGAIVAVSGTLVGVSNVTVVDATTVTATFTIGATANLTSRNVSVTTAAGASNNVSFLVQ